VALKLMRLSLPMSQRSLLSLGQHHNQADDNIRATVRIASQMGIEQLVEWDDWMDGMG